VSEGRRGVACAAHHASADGVRDDARCVRLMQEFIAARPELWNEDIGE
jgi:cytosine deaminase